MTREYRARRQPRFDVDGIEGNFLFSVDVDVQNLSIAGMAVETSQALAVGRRYVFNLGRGGDKLRIGARVAWCVLGRSRFGPDGEVEPVFHAGVQFENVLSSEAEGLLHMLEKAAVLDTENRVFGRFHLANRRLATVDSGTDFVIRRISRDGMMLEVEGVNPRFAAVDRVLPFEIRLGDETLNGEGRIAHVGRPGRDGAASGCTAIGVEFTSMSQWGRKVLDTYIASMVAN